MLTVHALREVPCVSTITTKKILTKIQLAVFHNRRDGGKHERKELSAGDFIALFYNLF